MQNLNSLKRNEGYLIMARPLRIEFPGAVYHITSRGNTREPIFLDEKDKKNFLEIQIL